MIPSGRRVRGRKLHCTICNTIEGTRLHRFETMNSDKFNSPQMEFCFAETVTSKRKRKSRARKSAAQLRAEKLAQTEGVAEAGSLKTPFNAPSGASIKSTTRIIGLMLRVSSVENGSKTFVETSEAPVI